MTTNGHTYEITAARRPRYQSRMLWLGALLLALGALLVQFGAEDGAGMFGAGLFFLGVVITPVAVLRLIFRK